jgi:ubiquinone/menaquinone biosynthesis C-methylase UbiE
MSYTRFDRFIAKQRYLAAYPHIRESSRVCDVGCGMEAGFLNFAAARISAGVGVDDQANISSPSRWKLVNADLLKGLPFEEQQFDHVVMLAVLEHLPQPRPVLSECFRILAPGGSLILTWPSSLVDPLLKLLHAMGFVSKEMESQEHQKRLPLADLRTMLEGIGFAKFFHRTFEFGLNNLLVAYRPESFSADSKTT